MEESSQSCQCEDWWANTSLQQVEPATARRSKTGSNHMMLAAFLASPVSFCFFFLSCFYTSRQRERSFPLSASSVALSVCLSTASPSLSPSASLFLPSSSLLILFISHIDGPQRHSAELSDLNKCLRLEPGLSCGLGCQIGSRCSSRTVCDTTF